MTYLFFWIPSYPVSLFSLSLQGEQTHNQHTMLLQRRVVVIVAFLATTVATTAAFNLKGERIFNKNSFCDVCWAFGGRSPIFSLHYLVSGVSISQRLPSRRGLFHHFFQDSLSDLFLHMYRNKTVDSFHPFIIRHLSCFQNTLFVDLSIKIPILA